MEITVSSLAGLLTGQLLFGNDPIPSGVFNSRAAPIHRAHGKQFGKHYRGLKESKIIPTAQMFPKMTGVVMDTTGKRTCPGYSLGRVHRRGEISSALVGNATVIG